MRARACAAALALALVAACDCEPERRDEDMTLGSLDPTTENGVPPPEPAPQSTATLVAVVRDGVAATGFETAGLAFLRNGTATAAEVGMRLQPGDELATDASTRAIVRFDEGYELVLDAGGSMAVENPSVFLRIGRAFVRSIEGLRGPFRVRTRYVAAGVEGTEFQVVVDSSEGLSVSVLEGVVRVEPLVGAWAPAVYAAGEQGFVAAGAAPVRMEPLPVFEQERLRSWVLEIDRAATGLDLPLAPADPGTPPPSPETPMTEEEEAATVAAIQSMVGYLNGVTDDLNAASRSADAGDYSAAEVSLDQARRAIMLTDEAFADLGRRRGSERYHLIYELARVNREAHRAVVALTDSMISHARAGAVESYSATVDQRNAHIETYNLRMDSLNALIP